MNRKKINKILSCVLSSLYICNTSSVFALDVNQEDLVAIESNIDSESNKTLGATDISDDLTVSINDTEEDVINDIESTDSQVDEYLKEDTILAEEGLEFSNQNREDSVKDESALLDEEEDSKTSTFDVLENAINTSNTDVDLSDKEEALQNLNQKSTEVSFEDVNLLKAVNKALSKGEVTSAVTSDEMASLNSLDISRLSITSLVGLEYAVNLKSLTANNNTIDDLTPISNLNSLTQLSFQGNPKFNENQFNKIGSLPNLVYLVMPINAPESIINVGVNNSLPNIQYLNICNSAIGYLNINNTNSLSTLVSDNCNIGDFTLNNSTVSSVSIQNSMFRNIKMENCSSLTSVSASFIEFENLYVADCNNFAYISFINPKIKNMTFKNVPLMAGISLGNVTMNDLILENISSRCTVTLSSNSSVNNVKIVDSKVTSFDISTSTIQNIELSNLNELNYLTARMSTVNALSLNNCPNIRSIVAPAAKLPNIDFSKLSNLGSLDLGYAEMDTVNISNSNILNSLNIMNAKINNLRLDNLGAMSTLGLVGSTFEDVYISNMPNLNDLGVNGLIAKNIKVENCDNLSLINGLPKKVTSLELLNLNSLPSLNIFNCGLEDLKIENCSKLSTLNANSNSLSSLDGFLVPSITNLNLSNNKIKDISNINTLSLLQDLNLDNNHISNISYLKGILSLSTSNISVLNQTVTLADYYSASGKVTLDNISVFDYDGNVVPVTQLPQGGSIVDGSVILGDYAEGVYDESIELSSIQTNYSIAASQKIIVDGTAPILNITPSTVSYVKDKVVLTIEAGDLLSGLDYIKLSDGTITKSSKIEFDVTENNTYLFEAVDLVGNSAEKSITISNIDKEAPIVNVSVDYNEDYTKATIVVNTTDLLSGVSAINIHGKQTVNSETTSLVISENGEYDIEVVDAVGNTYKGTIKVDSIKEKLILDDNNDDNNDDNSNNTINDSNLNKLPDSSGLGLLIRLAAFISLLFGTIAIKKNK